MLLVSLWRLTPSEVIRLQKAEWTHQHMAQLAEVLRLTSPRLSMRTLSANVSEVRADACVEPVRPAQQGCCEAEGMAASLNAS